MEINHAALTNSANTAELHEIFINTLLLVQVPAKALRFVQVLEPSSLLVV
ncbi:hypothetical protein VIBNIAM115_1330005 [Vibrio nigripulchritudo AM115]|nr:hypothetical protein VIBNIAM115_1330005 [Vibrio nigripulchritudo AM115]